MSKHYAYKREDGYWTLSEDPSPWHNTVLIALGLVVATILVWGFSSIEDIDFTPTPSHSPQVPF